MLDITDLDEKIDSTDALMIIDKFLEEFKAEYISARSKHGGFHSFHEGYAVIKEEFEELWDEIKKQKHDRYKLSREAIQVGAMVVAFLVELLPEYKSIL